MAPDVLGVPAGGGPASSEGSPRVHLLGVAIDSLTEQQAVDYVMSRVALGIGGRVTTPNVDILRATRRDAGALRLVLASDLVLADGMPLLWASRLMRTPLPARVTGASLIHSLSAASSRQGASVFVVGGPPGVAARAADLLRAEAPGLIIAGTCCPPLGYEADEELHGDVVREVVAARPDLVFLGLGFPKQERLAEQLQRQLPTTWFVGCGGAVSFAAGDTTRAPGWMQRTGLEWLHRLRGEPLRLGRRYLVHDIPFALVLLAGAALSRGSLVVARLGCGRRSGQPSR